MQLKFLFKRRADKSKLKGNIHCHKTSEESGNLQTDMWSFDVVMDR